jgi:hypothetical protein
MDYPKKPTSKYQWGEFEEKEYAMLLTMRIHGLLYL